MTCVRFEHISVRILSAVPFATPAYAAAKVIMERMSPYVIKPIDEVRVRKDFGRASNLRMVAG